MAKTINQKIKKEFIQIYGESDADIRIFYSSGKATLLGGQLEYNDGSILTAAAMPKCYAAFRLNEGAAFRMAHSSKKQISQVNLNSLYNYRNMGEEGKLAGIAYMLKRAGYEILPCDILFYSEQKNSCSASFDVAAALGFVCLSNDFKMLKTKVDFTEISKICLSLSTSSNFVDKFVPAMAAKNNALLLDCCHQSFKYIPFVQEDFEFVIIDTSADKSQTLQSTREQYDQALKTLKPVLNNITTLTDIIPLLLEECRAVLPDALYSRIEYLTYESDRVQNGVRALLNEDINELGKIMTDSLASFLELFEIEDNAANLLIQIASSNNQACLGVNMAGNGFDGKYIALTQNSEELLGLLKSQFANASIKASFYKTAANGGVAELVE